MMKKLSMLVASLALLVLIGGGCTVSEGGETLVDIGNVGSSETVSLNESASAGDIGHKVTMAETLDEIPESYTIEEWEIIAEPLPADDGFMWVHVKGEVTNNSKESQSMLSTSVAVIDADGNKFSPSTDTTIYVEDDESPIYLELSPTQTKTWDAYFLVPEGASDLMLSLNDLSFLPESEVVVDLGL